MSDDDGKESEKIMKKLVDDLKTDAKYLSIFGIPLIILLGFYEYTTDPSLFLK